MSRTKSEIPWFNHQHRKIIKQKRKAYNNAKKSNLPDDWITFKSLRRNSDRLLRKSRSQFINKLGDNLATNNTKPFWRYVKGLRKDSINISTLNTPNGIVTTGIDKANALNKHFQTVFTKENTTNIPSINSATSPQIAPIQINTQGIAKLLSELNPQKAPGPDGITPRILKECSKSIAPILRQIFQSSIDTGDLPIDWLNANVTPIYKNGDRTDPANYRPISLTSICCKLLEHIIHSNIMQHFDNFNILNAQQHGFRKGRSCETQLALTIDDITASLDKKKQIGVIILDFSKAFDAVPHERLLSKLKHSVLIALCSNGLTNSDKKVLTGGY